MIQNRLPSNKGIKIFLNGATKSLTKFMGQVHDTDLTLVM
jgi:hypothetical protein